jgi:predicted AlkP superfamily pyrophosphatase or phosphodiesterase
MHGYFPSSPDMRSTFLIRGRGIAAGRNLGEIDMRAIAPTLARLMGATLAAAEQPAIELGEAMPALRR